MRATSGTLFFRVNTGATENAGMENARRSKRDTWKPGNRHTLPNSTFNKKHMTHTSGSSEPKTQFGTSPPVSICYTVKIIIILLLLTTFS